MTLDRSRTVSTPVARVLVVDDDEHMVIIIQALLIDAGYQVLSASDGLEALEIARAFRPNAVVSDLQMPRMGGLELRREARLDPDLASVPFLFVTAYQESLEAVTGSLLSRDRALRKPIDPDLLLLTLEGILRTEA